MFQFLIDILDENGRGIHAYRICAERGRAAMAENAGATGALYILAQSAESFADMNERMPITAADIEAAHDAFRTKVETLNAAWKDGSDGAKLAALNKVAALPATPR